jgi:hypothetical protein
MGLIITWFRELREIMYQFTTTIKKSMISVTYIKGHVGMQAGTSWTVAINCTNKYPARAQGVPLSRVANSRLNWYELF